MELLTRGFADDRLSEAELEAMLDRVYGARTMEELRAVITPFVEEERGARGRGETSPTVRDRAGGALASRRRISSFLSGHTQRLTGVMPSELEIRSRLGHVELDLLDATFQPGVTEIDVRALMGYVEVRLPSGVRVESEGRAVMGYFALQGAGNDESDSVVRIKGRAVMGYAECFVVRRRPDDGK